MGLLVMDGTEKQADRKLLRRMEYTACSATQTFFQTVTSRVTVMSIIKAITIFFNIRYFLVFYGRPEHLDFELFRSVPSKSENS